MGTLFSRVTNSSEEVENVAVRKWKYENEIAERKYGSEKVGSQTLPVWAGHSAHTGKVWELFPDYNGLAKG